MLLLPLLVFLLLPVLLLLCVLPPPLRSIACSLLPLLLCWASLIVAHETVLATSSTAHAAVARYRGSAYRVTFLPPRSVSRLPPLLRLPCFDSCCCHSLVPVMSSSASTSTVSAAAPAPAPVASASSAAASSTTVSAPASKPVVAVAPVPAPASQSYAAASAASASVGVVTSLASSSSLFVMSASSSSTFTAPALSFTPAILSEGHVQQAVLVEASSVFVWFVLAFSVFLQSHHRLLDCVRLFVLCSWAKGPVSRSSTKWFRERLPRAGRLTSGLSDRLA